MVRGKAGQTSSVSLAGVLAVQTSCKSRRRGDPKTRVLQRRHTCTSFCHDSIFLFACSSSGRNRFRTTSTFMQRSNIDSRTSSGSTEIGIAWPTTHDQISSSRKMLPNKRRTSTLFSSFLQSLATTFCHRRAFGTGDSVAGNLEGILLMRNIFANFIITVPYRCHHPKGEFNWSLVSGLHLNSRNVPRKRRLSTRWRCAFMLS